MKYIACDSDLNRYLPNFIAPATGESSLFEKITVYIQASEDWIDSTFNPTPCISLVTNIVAGIVAYDGLHRAVPSLDLVYTPNGFGVVSTSTIAPASKSRIDNLTNSLIVNRDDLIAELLTVLATQSEWLESSTGKLFTTTLFPTFEILDALKITDNRWAEYLAVRNNVMAIEDYISYDFIGDEYMDELRIHSALDDLAIGSSEYAVLRGIKSAIISAIKHENSNLKSLLIPVIHRMKLEPDVFSTWHSSSISTSFNPPIFENDKNSSGYFF